MCRMSGLPGTDSLSEARLPNTRASPEAGAVTQVQEGCGVIRKIGPDLRCLPVSGNSPVLSNT